MRISFRSSVADANLPWYSELALVQMYLLRVLCEDVEAETDMCPQLAGVVGVHGPCWLQCLGFKSQPHHFLPVRPWASSFTCLGTHFLICKVDMLITTLQGCAGTSVRESKMYLAQEEKQETAALSLAAREDRCSPQRPVYTGLPVGCDFLISVSWRRGGHSVPIY